MHAAELGEKVKKPQSVYLDELVHSRVSQMVENALDGHGTLGGFFAFIEERAQYFRELLPEVRDNEDLAALLDIEDGVQQRAERQEKVGLPHNPDINKLFLVPLDDVHAYLEAWNLVAPTLPWHKDNPVASHVLALYLLSFNPLLWQEDLKSSPSYSIRSHYLHFFFYEKSLFEVVTRLQLTGTQGGTRLKWHPWLTEYYPAVWQRGRVDIIINNADLPRSSYSFNTAVEGRPKVKPTSFYLDKAAHDFVYAIFGNDLYNSAEHALHRLFTKPEYWIDITAETRFLEHGVELFDLEQAVLDPDRGLFASEFDEPAGDGEADALLQFRQGLLARVEKPFWKTFSAGSAADNYGWALNSPPALRLAHHLKVYALENQHVDLAQLEEDVATYLANSQDDDVRGGERQIAHGRRQELLLQALTDDLAKIHNDILATFLQHYQLQSLMPERSLAYRILKGKVLPEVDPKVFSDPVEYHFFELFRLYALEVLPERGREEERVSLPVLATLAQSWVFPTKSALEAYSTTKVRKTAEGKWQLRKGNKTLMELTNAEAFEVAWMLWGLAPPLMSYDYPGEDSGILDYDHWLEDYVSISLPFRKYLRQEGRLAITTGPALIERVLELVKQSKQRWLERDPERDRVHPLHYGIQRLHQEVVDEAMNGNGAIAAELAKEFDMKG